MPILQLFILSYPFVYQTRNIKQLQNNYVDVKRGFCRMVKQCMHVVDGPLNERWFYRF